MQNRPWEQNRPLTWWETLLEEHIELDPAKTDKPMEFAKAYDVIAGRIAGFDECDKANAGLAEVHRLIHSSSHKTRALCFSGGGIRSATFNLGLLQGLAKKEWLDQFDYLSTVSGGGYMGAWLSAWVHRLGGIHQVQTELRRTTRARPDSTRSMGFESNEDQPTLTLEPSEVNYLREYSNYLTPRLGWFTGDTWMLIATYIRNLLLNWTVLIPIAVGLVAFVWAGYFAFCTLAVWLTEQEKLSPDAWRIIEQPGPTLVSWLHLALLLFGIGAAIPLLPNFAAVRDSKKDKNKSQIEVDAHRRAGRLRPIWFVILPVTLSACLLPASSYAWKPVPQSGYSLSTMFPTMLYAWAILALAVTVVTAVVLKTQSSHRLGKPAPGSIGWFKIYGLYFIACAVSSFVGFVVMAYLFELRDQHTVLFFWLLPPVRLMQVYLFFTVIVGGLSEVTSPDLEESREWWSRLMGLLLLSAVAYLAVVGLLLVAPRYLFFNGVRDAYATPTLSVSLLAGIGAVMAGKSTFTGAISTVARNRMQSMVQILPALLAAVFLVAATLVAAKVTTWMIVYVGYGDSTQWAYEQLFSHTINEFNPIHNLGVALAIGGTGLLLGILMAWPINVNRFSLHNIYRMRLVRAYLGASRGEDREAEAFTGFDGKDNLPMHFLRRSRYFAEADLFTGTTMEQDLKRLCLFLVDEQVKGDDQKHAPKANPVAARMRTHAASPLCDPAKSHAVFDYLEKESSEGVAKIVLDTFNAALDDIELINHAGSDLSDAAWHASEQSVSDGQTYMVNRLVIEHAVSQFSGQPLAGARAAKPLHVVNAALNLVAGKKLAWQERKARSFTFTPLRCGFDYGYRPTSLYADGLSLGGAMTISGAAASPNMGYHSSPIVTALMTLFNVRLGAWLGNPAVPSDQDRLTPAQSAALNAKPRLWSSGIRARPAYRLASPRFSFQPLIDEFFGRTTEDSQHVYLSDGGHFENLGLYEMVRRRCSVIILSDASCDPGTRLADLGNAIRKIRIDLGIRVEMMRVNLKATQETDATVEHCTVGQIRYSDVDGPDADDGRFIYIKPTLKGAEPVDIYHYSRENNAFPHETTADQWFAEAQFESYRRLGELSADDIFNALKAVPQPALERTIHALDKLIQARRRTRSDPVGRGR
ncbi:MAG TPA: patatin-like phospholipase family protein [Tepidisphaeraceae bacterium]|jgi:hypothetical protein